MAYIKEESVEVIKTDENGKQVSEKEIRTTNIRRNTEPNYIKIYTDMWCKFNQIPNRWHDLFFELVMRMSYCNSMDLNHSQTVYVGGKHGEAIRNSLGWTSKDSLVKGLRELCACGAIRRVARGEYQINPKYAGKGEWRYNPTRDQGGIEDLIAHFSFKDKEVSTEIIWANDGSDKQDQLDSIKAITVKGS